MNAKKNQYLILLVCALFLITVPSCENSTAIESPTWQLVWQDEFEGAAGQRPDSTKWTYDIGTDWGNQQLEYDTDRPQNVSLDGNGNLLITARREAYMGQPFTSGRIKTQGLYEQTYGRYEARIKMPWGPGIWPAFWLLGSNIETVGWPNCGEIDIMEYRGQQPNLIHGTVHGPGYSGGAGISKTYGFEHKRFDVDFHVFAVEWGADYLKFFVDDVMYHQIKKGDVPGQWVFDSPFFIILNVAVGGNYVGFPTSQTPFPQSMVVDYVRVYKAL
ncbi:MAG: glycoside hydrolase family 16 protein [Ignavibacteriaceae bacterium]|nr:glycoside hydrolase family 16 protein [Ignavibacteriaceae bacterium]